VRVLTVDTVQRQLIQTVDTDLLLHHHIQ